MAARGNTANLVKDQLFGHIVTDSFKNAKYTKPTDLKIRLDYIDSVLQGFGISTIIPQPELIQLELFVRSLLNKSFDKKNYIVHNGLQIPNIPFFNEMLRRIVSPMYLEHISVPVSNESDAMLLDTWKHIPPVLEDAYIASLNVPSGLASKWDARVKQICDALAVRSATSGSTEFDTKNIINQPSLQTVTMINSVNPSIASIVYAQNDLNAVGRPVVRQPALFSLGVNNYRGLGGGSVRNLHAPLYPKMVMNGGAHPFAVLAGGASAIDNQILIWQSRIDAIKQQYQSASGAAIDADIANQIQLYIGQVRIGYEGLEKDLQNVRDAAGYLAQNPLAEGVVRPSLEELAEKGRAVTEKSLKLSRQFGKLSTIESLLQDLLAQVKPRNA